MPGLSVEIVDITKLRINYCKGCGTCYGKGRCGQDDDFCYVMDRIAGSDGIVLGSPAYFDSVTAQMKTLMDRMSDVIHCQQLRGKYGCSVCTTGSSGEGLVISYMNDFLIMCGAFVTGGTGAAIGNDTHSLDCATVAAHAMGKDLVAAIQEKRTYADQADRQQENRKRLRGRISGEQRALGTRLFLLGSAGLDLIISVSAGSPGTAPCTARCRVSTPDAQAAGSRCWTAGQGRRGCCRRE